MTPAKEQVTRIAAYGLVLRKGHILLCRLSRSMPVDAGAWTLPGGGIEFGEDPADAMVREVHEETGLIVRPAGLVGIDSFRDEGELRDFHSIRIIYRTVIEGGSLKNELNGSTDLCAWWTYEEAKALPLVELAEVGLDLAYSNESCWHYR